jgi:TPR repeat protein
MMVSSNGAFGILIGAAVGTLFLVPAHGSAQGAPPVACVDVVFSSPLENLTRCAELGDAYAQYYLGLKYGTTGQGVPQDDAEAVRWYGLAAEQGYADAQVSLGMMYANGVGVAEDDREAVRWYRLAAEQGNTVAQFLLGFQYTNGYGVPRDDTEAVRWYRLSAERGNADAQRLLGSLYRAGAGVPQDLVYSYMWYNLSAAQGNEDAQSNKDLIESLMTREQIAEAQRLSREWIEAHPQDGGN